MQVASAAAFAGHGTPAKFCPANLTNVVKLKVTNIEIVPASFRDSYTLYVSNEDLGVSDSRFLRLFSMSAG